MTIFTNVEDLRQQSKRILPRMLFDFVDGGSYDEATLRRNESDFDSLHLRQRVMVDTSGKRLGRTVLGHAYDLPVGISPIGMGGFYYPDGEVVGLAAAENWNVPFTLSTLSICSLEQLRESTERPFWFQLYVMKDRAFTESLIQRAEQAGCSALVLTVDLPISGQRHRDIKNGLSVPLRFSGTHMLDVMRRHRWWRRQLRAKSKSFGNLTDMASAKDSKLMGLAQWCASQYDPSLSWADVSWVRRLWKGKLIVKGVLNSDDARHAIDSGCDAVIVSNHGGRQLDGARSTISSLRSIATAVNRQVPVLLDGGIRSGQDIIRALALGADFCMMGRPYVYALAVDGPKGLDTLFTILRNELEVCMALMGIRHLSEVDASCLDNPDHFSR
ncbi:alpha-hydroxy acid oxidase [Bordetella sp. 02P26C-1]|uniref:alpha-hydroxy acid oxidase n=1 Tax=Bordetella sp. 02P26C-1 TaxID=2683195 RepID=UPI0013546528|nr:alpha-hydroxy acid oxidase [Bordetella sp. 02P26C-1]MVW77595.1 L-lactate dehydrogenase [Bordetella sp. 02P26C-1]